MYSNHPPDYGKWDANHTNTTFGRPEIPSLVYVTAFLNLNEDRSKDKSPQKCFEHFRTLAASGIPICLYMSPDYEEVASQFAAEFPNVHIAGIVELKNLETYKYIKELGFDQLPQNRNEYHDTLNFFIMMHAKLEFVYNIAKHGITQNYAWIDFSICHILKNPKETLKRLYLLAYSKIKCDTVLFPGCYSLERSSAMINSSLDNINWRFCGGFFFGNSNKCVESYQIQNNVLKVISNNKKLPWEVNTWAIMENMYGENWSHQVYMADHNDSMITNIDLSQLIDVYASITTIPTRISALKPTIDSLINQVSFLYVNLCESYERFPEYTKDDIKQLIKQYLDIDIDIDVDDPPARDNYQKLIFRFGPDYGPATKYLGSIDKQNTNVWYFYGDDDQEYHPTLIRRMLANVTDIGTVYQNRYEIVKTGSGGLIHGYVGNLAHHSLICDKLPDFPLSPDSRFVDDQWMSIYYFVNNIPIRPSTIEQYSEIFASLAPGGFEKIGANSLASLGNRADKVAALEREFGVHFLKNGNLIRESAMNEFDITKYIDGIIYINLDHRTDRREQIESELYKFGLPYNRFPGIATPGFGILGCGYSHLEVLKKARDQNWKNVLIFEDDFQFLVSKPEFVYQIRQLFEDNPVTFDVCMLSYNLLRQEPHSKQYLTKALDVQTASGYIVNCTMFEPLIKLYEESFPILQSTRQHWIWANDQIWKRLQPDSRWYCFATRLGKQRPSYSDNGQSWAELDC